MFGHFNVVGKVYKNEILLHDEVDTLALQEKHAMMQEDIFDQLKFLVF